MNESELRQQAACRVLAEIFASLSRDLSSATNPGEFTQTLHIINRTSAAGKAFLAALDGVEFPLGVEPATGQGMYGGTVGSVLQTSENYGSRVIAELMALARAWIAQQAPPLPPAPSEDPTPGTVFRDNP